MQPSSSVTDHSAPGVSLTDAIRLMSRCYGPFSEEPRLDPAHELVFTILSQHTSDTNSARAFRRLMDRFGTLEAVARGSVQEIEEAISSGGLARIKAPRIKNVLNRILALNGSLDLSFLREMPLDQAKAWLRQLPGIGPKSAGIILSFALGRPAMAIDTHIYRVCKRLGVIGPKVTAEKAHELLEAMVEPAQVFQFHVAFINHGRRVCKAQRPRCAECVVARGCPSRSYFMDENSPPGSAFTLGSDGRAPTPAQIPHSLPVEDNEA
ncbi:MAG: endonuclease III [Chloroflexota bacterium]